MSTSDGQQQHSPGTAYDLWFEVDGGIATNPSAEATRPLPTDAPAGWIGGAGPGIDTAAWPRGPLTGLPMFHALTLVLPPEFRRRGEHLPAVAFFQGEGQFAAPRPPAAAGDPFEADVAAAVDHPRLERRVDIIDGQFALLRLTAEEVDAGPTAPPRDSRRPGEHEETDEGPNAWDTHGPTRRVWLRERVDPNAGLAPVDPVDGATTPGYVSPFGDDFQLLPWAEALATSHLGGTCFPIQALPEGLTPFYLELDELPGLNFGSGSAQLDLESDVFDWACG